MPGDYVENLTNAKFWHYQFAKSSEARRWLHWSQENQREGDLPADIEAEAVAAQQPQFQKVRSRG